MAMSLRQGFARTVAHRGGDILCCPVANRSGDGLADSPHRHKTYSVTASYHECFTLAAIAPIPLWLSSLALFVPSLLINMVGILALFGSTGLIYHGVYALFHMRENLQALQMATVIAGAGLFAWLVLVQIVLMH